MLRWKSWRIFIDFVENDEMEKRYYSKYIEESISPIEIDTREEHFCHSGRNQSEQ